MSKYAWNSVSLALNPFTPISSKRTFSQPFKEKCIGEVVRVDGIIIFLLSSEEAMKSQVLHTVCYVIFLVIEPGKKKG